ncbi:putative ABC transport system permease protein [Paenibacillus forsythiae]|uniref:ABC transport system permease protein n=1 Tax=Paenibacillus forsythiae TaxID=365616 RepID=A0ABU3HBQ7_9BACL|nr:FtsX-like permease family protein [Paenibacillus forsythiae]MDT3428259.1 putative ABC transport system permease protein [Paenibacillus forsythiae]
MRRILNDIWISKKIFTMLFIGFLLTLLPILIALSTRNYYDEHFYYSINGHYKYYYSITLQNIKKTDFLTLQNIADSSFSSSSVITKDITIMEPEIGPIQVVGLLNNLWKPPLLQGTGIESDEANEIIAGKLISDHVGTMKIMGKEYHVKGIAGKDAGRDLINVFNFKMYVYLNEIPASVKRIFDKQDALELLVRSNQNPKNEMNRFISEVKQHDPEVNASTDNESPKYEAEKNSRQGVKEVLSYPYKLFLMALINCVNVSYLWIYVKRKEISLRKALGASNLALFVYIMSQLSICAGLAAIFTFFVQWLLTGLNLTIVNNTSYFVSLNLGHIIIGFLVTLSIAFLTSLVPLLHILKIEPARALKE